MWGIGELINDNDYHHLSSEMIDDRFYARNLSSEMFDAQSGSAKFVTNRYPKKNHYHEFSISNIINDLKWDTLEQRRNKARVTTAYKILNKTFAGDTFRDKRGRS